MDTGVVRKIDELGRIVIPKEIRKNLNIRNGEDVSIFVKDNMIDAISFNENNYGNNSTGFYLYGTLDNEVKGNLKETIEKEAFR